MPGRDGTGQPPLAVRRVKRAHQQVADQLREWIVGGTLAAGDKLPGEAMLAEQFGTSRSTVREALRTLASESLIVTRPGVGGGSIVQHPDPESFRDSLKLSLTLLVGANDLTPEELIDVREMLEAPSASKAARLRSSDDISRLRELIPRHPAALDAEAMFTIDRAFHETLLRIGGNRLLPMVVTPIYEVSARRFERSLAPATFWESVADHHTAIVDAIEAGDADAAQTAMVRHLRAIAPMYDDLERAPRS